MAALSLFSTGLLPTTPHSFAGGRLPARKGGRGRGSGGKRGQQQPNSQRWPPGDPRADGRLPYTPGRGPGSDAGVTSKLEAATAMAAVTPRSGRQESGDKRASGVIDAVEGSAIRDFKGGRTNSAKRSKKTEATVLWSPGKRGREGPSVVGDGKGDTGIGGSINGNSSGLKRYGVAGSTRDVGGRSLASLARAFKERHGEDLRLDEEDDTEETEEEDEPAMSTRRIKRDRSRSGDHTTVAAAATAATMSPAKLAAEIQRARARAREERFGGGSQLRPAKGLRVASLPEKGASGGMAKVQAMAATAAIIASNRSSTEVELFGTTVPKSSESSTAPDIANASSTSSAVPLAVVPAAVRISPTGGAMTNVPVPSVHSVSQDVPVATAAAVAAVVPRKQVSALETVGAEKSSEKDTPASSVPATQRTTSGAGSTSIQTPAVAKKSWPRQHSISFNSHQTPKTAPKVLTLRLRLRDDAPAEPKPQPPEPTVDGGVEESKGFDPPNIRPDNGVEECKGFEPPNLPPASAVVSTAASHSTAAYPLSTGGGSVPVPVATGRAPLCPGVSATNTRGSTPSRPRTGFWGPSFGIEAVGSASVGGPAAAVVRVNPSTPPAPNPWIISPDAPTFAKNQGRPLSRSSSHSSPSTGISSTRSGESAASYPARAVPENARTAATDQVGHGVGSGETEGAEVGGKEVSHGDSGTADGAGIPGHLSKKQGSAFLAGSVGGPRCTQPAGVATGLSRQEDGLGGQGQEHPAQYVARLLDAQQRNTEQHNTTRQRDSTAAGQIMGSAGSLAAESSRGNEAVVGTKRGERARVGGILQGVRVGGGAKELLERLKREREESLELERKLTQALLDL